MNFFPVARWRSVLLHFPAWPRRNLPLTAAQARRPSQSQPPVKALPRWVNADRIASNIDIFGFELAVDEMAAIDALNTGKRNGPNPDIFDMAFLKARQQQAQK